MRRMLRRISLCFALFGASACAVRDGARDEHVLRYASPYSPLHPFSRADTTWMKHVEAASGGRLRVRPYWSGALLSGEQSLLELRHGIADVATIQPIYARGGAHVLRAQAGFYAGASGFASQVAVYKCLAREFPAFAGELTGLEVLAVQGGNLPGIVTGKRQVVSVDDLSGLRLRAPAELIEVLEALGADPVSMPMGDVYSALAKGVIDGVVVAPDALRALHLAEVAGYYATVAIPRGGYPARAVSARALARLPADLRAILRASGPVWEAALAEELKAALATGERYGRERGMQFVHWEPAAQARFEAVYNEVAQRSARRLGARGVDGVALFARAQHWTRVAEARPAAERSSLCP